MSHSLRQLIEFVEKATNCPIHVIDQETIHEARTRVERHFGKPMRFIVPGKKDLLSSEKLNVQVDRILR